MNTHFRPLLALLTLIGLQTLTGCAVVSVAGSVAGAAVSVGASVVSAGVEVTGAAVGATINAVSSSDASSSNEKPVK